VPCLPRFAPSNRRAALMTRLPSCPFDGVHDPVARRDRQWDKFSLRVLKDEAVLVLPAGGIRAERRDADTIFYFDRLLVPGIG
jgi:hypothetical protein